MGERDGGCPGGSVSVRIQWPRSTHPRRHGGNYASHLQTTGITTQPWSHGELAAWHPLGCAYQWPEQPALDCYLSGPGITTRPAFFVLASSGKPHRNTAIPSRQKTILLRGDWRTGSRTAGWGSLAVLCVCRPSLMAAINSPRRSNQQLITQSVAG